MFWGYPYFRKLPYRFRMTTPIHFRQWSHQQTRQPAPAWTVHAPHAPEAQRLVSCLTVAWRVTEKNKTKTNKMRVKLVSKTNFGPTLTYNLGPRFWCKTSFEVRLGPDPPLWSIQVCRRPRSGCGETEESWSWVLEWKICMYHVRVPRLCLPFLVANHGCIMMYLVTLILF